jgi:hypothetical protein
LVNLGILATGRIDPVRRILLLATLALAVPACALSASAAVSDGSLALDGASGTIYISGRGLIYGHFDSGTLMVLDYKADDGVSTPTVSSAKGKFAKVTGAFAGTDVRFLLPSGRYTIELIGAGIDASAVGKGSIVATGFASPDDGSYTVNGGKPQTLGKQPTTDLFGSKATTAAAAA